jgi:hypothetical protein
MPSLAVIGSGPGIALATTALFAEKKFSKVALLARSSQRLLQDKASILEILRAKGRADVEIETWCVDISDSPAFKQVLREVSHRLGDLTCVLFNAARVAPSQLLEVAEEEIVRDFMVCPLPTPLILFILLLACVLPSPPASHLADSDNPLSPSARPQMLPCTIRLAGRFPSSRPRRARRILRSWSLVACFGNTRSPCSSA